MSKQGANPEKHTHILEDGTVIEHTHGAEESSAPHDGVHMHTHEGAHTHTHDGVHTHTHDGVHTHTHDGTHTRTHDGVHTHAHGAHSHTHDPEHVKSVLNRISRAIGHLESIKRMVEDGRDCSEVLIQLSAVKAAINNTGKVILQDHIAHCLVDAVETGDMETIEELNKAIDRFIK